MNKTLFDLDMQIQRLRDELASGKASLKLGMELAALLDKRTELINSIGAENEKRLQDGGRQNI